MIRPIGDARNGWLEFVGWRSRVGVFWIDKRYHIGSSRTCAKKCIGYLCAGESWRFKRVTGLVILFLLAIYSGILRDRSRTGARLNRRLRLCFPKYSCDVGSCKVPLDKTPRIIPFSTIMHAQGVTKNFHLVTLGPESNWAHYLSQNFHLLAFNYCTLYRVGQQTTPDDFESPKFILCSLWNAYKTSFPNFNHDLFLSILCESGDPVPKALDHACVSITLTMRVEYALPDWIPINSRICLVWLDSRVPVAADCPPTIVLPRLYRDSPRSFQSMHSTDVVVMAVDFNVQFGCLWKTKAHRKPTVVVADRTDNRNKRPPICSDYISYLAGTNFRHRKATLAGWCWDRSHCQ